MIPEGRPPTPPPTPLIYWGDLSVTGNGDLPLATQRRVESIALIDRALLGRLTSSISLVCGPLFSSLFFFDFHRTNFSGFRLTFHQFRFGWLCYFCYYGHRAEGPGRASPSHSTRNVFSQSVRYVQQSLPTRNIQRLRRAGGVASYLEYLGICPPWHSPMKRFHIR